MRSPISREGTPDFSELFDLSPSAMDIYMVDQDRPGLYSRNFAVSDFHPDMSNVIIITLNDAQTKGILLTPIDSLGNEPLIEMTCDLCHKPTLYIRDFEHQWLCPVCALDKLKCRNLHTSCCNLPLGCQTCGGIPDGLSMVSIPRDGTDPLLLCARDECVMPFGYTIGKMAPEACTCGHEYVDCMKNKLLPELGVLIRSYMKIPRITFCSRMNVILPDFSIVSDLQCFPCQIQAGRTSISSELLVRGKDMVCSCCSFPWGRGSGLLSTPSTPSLRRRKSSGVRTEVYTPSTSDIC